MQGAYTNLQALEIGPWRRNTPFLGSPRSFSLIRPTREYNVQKDRN